MSECRTRVRRCSRIWAWLGVFALVLCVRARVEEGGTGLRHVLTNPLTWLESRVTRVGEEARAFLPIFLLIKNKNKNNIAGGLCCYIDRGPGMVSENKIHLLYILCLLKKRL